LSELDYNVNFLFALKGEFLKTVKIFNLEGD